MPRGNDAVAAGREALAEYGDHLHAEDLIRAHAATINPALQKILNSPYDEEETAAVKADLSKVEHLFSEGKSSGDLEDDEQILDAAVHGNAVVAVIETVHGDTRKAYAPYNEKFAEPKLSDAEQRRYEAAKADGEVAAETAAAREAAARRLREAREQIERDTDEELARIQRDAAEKVDAARKAAAEPAPSEPAAEDDEGKTSPVAETKKTGSSSSKKTSAKKTSAAKKKTAAKK